MSAAISAAVTVACQHPDCGDENEFDFDATDLDQCPLYMLAPCDACGEGIEVEINISVKGFSVTAQQVTR